MKRTMKTMLGCIGMAAMFAFSGCGGEEGDYSQTETLNDKTPQQTYEAIMTQIESQKTNFTSTIDYKIVIDMSYDGEKASVEMNMNTLTKMDGNDFLSSSNVEGGELFGTMAQNVAYVDGVAYIDVTATGDFGMTPLAKLGKVKYTASIEQICSLANIEQDEMFNPIYDFADTAFEDVKFYVGEDDSYFQLLLTGDDAAAYFEKIFGTMNIAAGITIPQIEYNFMLDKDGNFDYAKIGFELDMEVEGVSMKYEFDGIIRFTDVGTTVVTAPEGGEEYKDYTAFLPKN